MVAAPRDGGRRGGAARERGDRSFSRALFRARTRGERALSTLLACASRSHASSQDPIAQAKTDSVYEAAKDFDRLNLYVNMIIEGPEHDAEVAKFIPKLQQ